jgi:uncharacterized RDD family membrane protein YckC
VGGGGHDLDARLVGSTLLVEFYRSPEAIAQSGLRPIAARRAMPCKNHPFVEDHLTRCSICAEAFCPDCIVEIGGLPYCLSCKTETMRDLRSGVPTRELDLATIGRRFAALWLDGIIIGVPLMIVVFVLLVPLGILDEPPNNADYIQPLMFMYNGVTTLLLLGSYILYEGLMLSAGGQTLGKKALNIKVVTLDGGEISRGQAWARAIMRQILSFVPCLGLVDYLVAFGQERSCVHDIVAKTRVVNVS